MKKVRDGCRLGELVISEKDVLGNVQTPMCMLYTRGGKWTATVIVNAHNMHPHRCFVAICEALLG